MSDNSEYEPIDFGEDPAAEEISSPTESRKAIIRTSDRISFKKCRRKWGWNSHLRGNMGPKEAQNPLWFGTGMHYALEDFHGHNVYGDPIKAFKAYCIATHANRKSQPIPAIFKDLKELGIGMMDYYFNLWLKDRSPLQTFWYRGEPQVEVKVLLKVPFDLKAMYPDSPYDEVYYSLTIDRVVEDEDGDLWLLDYKSAKAMQTHFFATDPQIGVYYWAGHHIYPGRKIKGFIYQQHRKDVPDPPKLTAKGKLSTDKRQLTTHRAYRAILVNMYGPDFQKWPAENLDLLNALAQQETLDADKFVRRDRIYRNEYSHEAEGAKILMEVEDMLNPDLPLYPNPTRDCAYMCTFQSACVSMDDGSDWEGELEMFSHKRPVDQDEWTKFLPKPEDIKD